MTDHTEVDCSRKRGPGRTQFDYSTDPVASYGAMSSSSLFDCEKGGLRGPVQTIVDEYSTTVFDRNGKTVEGRGNTSHGRVERTYVYDQNERLIRVRGSSGDQDDEFRYDGRGKRQIRHVPPRPDRQSRAFGVSGWFDAISEGEGLTDGGTVETTYNERDEPVGKRLFDGYVKYSAS